MHEKLQYGDFGIMTHTLDKFLAFMNMTVSIKFQISSIISSIIDICRVMYSEKSRAFGRGLIVTYVSTCFE